MSDGHLLFGFDPDDITALTNVGLLLVTLVFSAIGALLAYRQQRPKPVFTVDIVERVSAFYGRYMLKVHNVAQHPIQLSQIEVDSDSAVRLSADKLVFVTVLTTSADIAPGAHAIVSFNVRALPDDQPLEPFVLHVGWHSQGTASRMKTSDIVCYH